MFGSKARPLCNLFFGLSRNIPRSRPTLTLKVPPSLPPKRKPLNFPPINRFASMFQETWHVADSRTSRTILMDPNQQFVGLMDQKEIYPGKVRVFSINALDSQRMMHLIQKDMDTPTAHLAFFKIIADNPVLALGKLLSAADLDTAEPVKEYIVLADLVKPHRIILKSTAPENPIEQTEMSRAGPSVG